ncbi:hypothetical protein R8Z50_21950 [Longispora sp. K20-0274]|uniref:hypothetical protein n=1 Tax=Longispora sp. K20-0274 TaxID=3088255 RepID=UPI00399BAD8D
MGELAPRAVKATAKAILGPIAEGLITVAFTHYGHDPDGGKLAGGIGKAYVEEGIDFVDSFFEERRRRIMLYTETADNLASGNTLVVFNAAARNPKLLEVLGRTVETASRSLDDPKIQALAGIYVRCAQDGARVDEALIMTDLLRDLEVPHLRLLRVLDGTPSPYTFPGTSNKVALWVRATILDRDPGLEPALDVLIGRITALGLMREDPENEADEPIWVLTEFGRKLVAQLNAVASSAGATSD